MKTPPFLLGAALLFWGWQTGLLIWAAPMAIILEASQFTHGRWDFSTADLKRIWNLCAVLFFGLGFILYSSEETVRFPLKFAQWLPFPFFPMILAQVYGSSEKIPLIVFSWFLRRAPERPLAKKSLNISFHYFGICLLGASATSLTNGFFYPGIVLLIGLALLSIRPLRLPQPIWILLVAAIGLAGHVGHQQLRVLHATVEGTLARIFVRLFSRDYNPDESRTAIGRVGRIELSGKIVLRVRPESANGTPALLRDASYDIYKGGVWRGSQNEFVTVFVDTNDVAHLQPAKKPNSAVRIASYLKRGNGQLALPLGAYELSDFPAGVLKTNRFGVAKVEEGPGLLNLLARYGPGSSIDAPPSEADTEIAPKEQSTVTEIVRELNLAGKSERAKIDIIDRFFRDNFKYSLEITRKHIDRSREKTALGQFLTEARSGHCEYFATAAVLLLREAGIQARYATGYVVDESQRKGKTYLVRERDAHAWVLVYRKDKGLWEEFDPTPASADRADAFKASKWESISDFFSNLKYQFSKWRWSENSSTGYLKWLLIPLVLILVWRILSHKRRRRNASQENQNLKIDWPGMDSELYLLNERLTSAGLSRFPNELLIQWQRRLSSSAPQAQTLDRIFSIHSRLRFDPHGVTPEERQILKEDVKQWLESFESEKSQRAIAIASDSSQKRNPA